jgi:hypothetical protein
MLTSDVCDKYIKAITRLKINPIKQKWITEFGACPLYIYTYFLMQRDMTVKLTEKTRIVEYMTNKFGLNFRNGFTAAIDELEPDSEDPFYVKGYEHGEGVRKKLWKK